MTIPDIPNLSLVLPGIILLVGNRLLGAIKGLPETVRDLVMRWFSVSVEIPEGTTGFRLARAFASEQQFIFRTRDFSLQEKGLTKGGIEWLTPPSPGTNYFWYEGRAACLTRSRRDLDGGVGGVAIFEHITLRFFRGTRETVLRFMAEAERFDQKPVKKSLKLMTWSSGSWDIPRDRPLRPLDSVVLAPGVMEDIRGKIGGFLGDADAYAVRGIPHRMGISLSGPPGGGKTSLVKALAAEYDACVCILPLTSASMNDSALLTTMSYVPRNSFVILEDLDRAFESGEKLADSESKVTFAGLLNAIDGVASSEHYILFITSNHPERFDEALMRKGRIDHTFTIGKVVKDQARRYFLRFFGEEHAGLAGRFEAAFADESCSMAELQGHFIANMGDPERALLTWDSTTRDT